MTRRARIGFAWSGLIRSGRWLSTRESQVPKGADISLTPAPAEATGGLALALVASSDTPLLLMSGDVGVVAASRSFCQAFRIDEASTRGHPLFSLGAGEWDVPQLRMLLKNTLAGESARISPRRAAWGAAWLRRWPTSCRRASK
jgi:hypothetical protein